MKLSGSQALGFCDRPDLDLHGALLHGADSGQVLDARRRLIAQILGDGTDELLLTRLAPGDIRKDPATLTDEVRARGFFPGRRVVLVEDAADGTAKAAKTALEGVNADDAFVIMTSGSLPARSSLRKLFETDRRLMSLQLFTNDLDPASVPGELASLGMKATVSQDATALIAETARSMDHGSVRQMLNQIAVFGMDGPDTLTANEVSKLLPRGLAGDADELVLAVASGQPHRIGQTLRRLAAEGAQPVGIILALQRHFRQLLQASLASGGPSAGLAGLRPPVWGTRRDQMAAQLRVWTPVKLEQASRVLLKADAQIRSTNRSPEMATVERTALRLAIMGQR